MRVLYSFVIDHDPRFLLEAEIFLRTLIGAGVSQNDIVAQVTERCGVDGKKLASRFAVRAVELPLGPDKTFCNKISQLSKLQGDEFDVLAACDTDLAILVPLTDVSRLDAVRARRVDSENPPLDVLENIRRFLGFQERPH